MNTVSSAVLIVLGLVVAANYRHKTLGKWLQAKFLNAGSPLPTTDAAQGKSGLGGQGSAGQGAGGGGGGSWGSVQPSSFAGKLVQPLLGKITGTFGEARPGHTHAGIDIAAPSGTPIVAAAGGRVVNTGVNADYGLMVDVDNGSGFITRYAHMSRIAVKGGQILDAGDPIGLVGATGRATGPHLHFELRHNGVPVDPTPYFGTAVPSRPPVWTGTI